MKSHEKVLQLNSNLSKLIDSLCFQLAVNIPDQNSLSLLQIIEWHKTGEINQEQFKQLYCNWLESKNVYDLFTVKQIKTYPKENLLIYQGPIKKILNNKDVNLIQNKITKILQTINIMYNELYIQKRIKAFPSNNTKTQIQTLQEVQQLFSFLDSQGLIHLRLNQMFFLISAMILSQNKPISPDFARFKNSFKKYLLQFNQINGCVSLRSFKNYFLINKNQPLLVKTLNAILNEIQGLSAYVSENNSKNPGLPNIFNQSFQKWKSYPRFKGKEKRIQFLKRVFQQNEHLLIFNDQTQTSSVEQDLRMKYGNEFVDCLQIDQFTISQFTHIIEDTLNNYINLFQKLSSNMNKGKSQKTQYINSSSNGINDYQNSSQKNKLENSYIESGRKQPKVSKEKTPIKKRKSDFTTSNNYTPSSTLQNKTPTHKNRTQVQTVHKQFGSHEKYTNSSGFGGTIRQTTPTKSSMSFQTQAPRTYRAAQKRGLCQNNIYDKLFFFRNKRVQSYQIVMKRLKNK